MVWNNKIVPDDDGNPAYVVLTGIDVTAERTAAGLVTHLVQASITTALIGIDDRGRITLFNSGAQRLLGLRRRRRCSAGRSSTCSTPTELADADGAAAPSPARFAALVDEHRAARREPAAGLDAGCAPRRRAAHGVDDPERRRGVAVGAPRLPVRRAATSPSSGTARRC